MTTFADYLKDLRTSKRVRCDWYAYFQHGEGQVIAKPGADSKVGSGP
jgi:hypothetical protein